MWRSSSVKYSRRRAPKDISPHSFHSQHIQVFSRATKHYSSAMTSTTSLSFTSTSTSSATPTCTSVIPDKNGYVPYGACGSQYNYVSYPLFQSSKISIKFDHAISTLLSALPYISLSVLAYLSAHTSSKLSTTRNGSYVGYLLWESVVSILNLHACCHTLTINHRRGICILRRSLPWHEKPTIRNLPHDLNHPGPSGSHMDQCFRLHGHGTDDLFLHPDARDLGIQGRKSCKDFCVA